ncbi:MAG: DEAD/DEAH box helicase [Verrucomicrobia bacterium]|nr:DEAD/DEAH box helicase [Verrucomicrobiota bacterium]
MEGKDVLAKCISNAGVVDAYAIPTVDSVDTNISEIQSLVLVNDRQRALIVAEEMRLYAEKKVGVSIGSIYTGQPGSVQDRVIKSKPHILVAQLKSLESLIEDEKVVFDELKLIVADELSDLANSGLEEAIETLLESTTEDTQFVAFTRSDSEIVLKVVEQFTDEYIQVSIEPAMEIEKPIIEEVYEVGRICKTEVLQRLLDFCDLQSSVLFVNSTVSAQSVRRVLDLKGYRTSCLTYSSTSAEKNDAMDYFNAGDIDFLIVTDLGAVGLDLEGVQQVIQYELSDEVDDFGDRVLLCEKNILLVAPEEISQLDIIEEAIGRSLKRFQVPFIEGLGTNDENRLFEAVSTRLVRNDFRRREAIIQRLLQVAPSTIDAMGAIMDYALEVQAKTRSGEDESRGARKPSRPVQNDSASGGGAAG